MNLTSHDLGGSGFRIPFNTLVDSAKRLERCQRHCSFVLLPPGLERQTVVQYPLIAGVKRASWVLQTLKKSFASSPEVSKQSPSHEMRKRSEMRYSLLL